MFLQLSKDKEEIEDYSSRTADLDMALQKVGYCKPTVNFLNIRTPKIFVVITLKFELCGSTIE